jgi:hypothetical protein
VAKVGTSKAGGTICQQDAVHPWLDADAHVNKETTLSHMQCTAGNGDVIRGHGGAATMQSIATRQCMVLFPTGAVKFHFLQNPRPDLEAHKMGTRGSLPRGRLQLKCDGTR